MSDDALMLGGYAFLLSSLFIPVKYLGKFIQNKYSQTELDIIGFFVLIICGLILIYYGDKD